MVRRIGLAVLASTFVGAPVLATSAQAQTYRVTSIHQIAPNPLKYLLSHWTGAGSLEAKLRAVETKLMGKTIMEGVEGREGREGPAGAVGPAGPQGITGPAGESIEGPEGPASTIPGPAGERGERGETGEAGPEGAASEVPGPQGPAGPQGERGPACEVKVEPACASTVPGPEGKEGKQGPKGEAGPEGSAGPEGKAGPAGPQGEKGERGETGPEGAGGTPTAFVAGLQYTGNFGGENGHLMFAKHVPAGDYVITGSISFERSENAPAAEILCETYLAGVLLARSPDIIANTDAAAMIVADTGETSGGNLEVNCAPIHLNTKAGETTSAKFGSLAAIPAKFQ
jgi:hypothetical protein